MAAEEMSILKEAREIVRTRPMDLRVGNLRTCADALQEAYDVLKVSLTRDTATNFIGQITRTLVAIERVHEFSPPTPTGGRMPVEKEREQVGAPAAR